MLLVDHVDVDDLEENPLGQLRLEELACVLLGKQDCVPLIGVGMVHLVFRQAGACCLHHGHDHHVLFVKPDLHNCVLCGWDHNCTIQASHHKMIYLMGSIC